MKKIFKAITLFTLIIVLCACGKQETYNFGDKVSVQLNDNLAKEFYVIKDEEKTVKLLATESIGTTKFNDVQEGYGCQFYGDCKSYNRYEESVIETFLKDNTKEWTNIESVSLLDIEDLLEPLSISNKYFYKRTTDEVEISEYNELFNKEYWLYNTYTKSINFTWIISNNKFTTKNIEEILDVYPVITIGKKHIIK